ncbi:MAG: zinc-finger domain-containing protein [Caulobacterales bacterium]|nr:zinc-finger domain-containing protein [Caulobacterales bacterium]
MNASADGAPPPPEIILVDAKRVSCDGGGGALGHPKVWYDMGEDDFVECGYCDRRFALRGSPADPTAAASPEGAA